MHQNILCGLSFWHPKWLQKFATTRSFVLVYGLLGTVQAMSYLYFVVTLTTIEKRFKIPSQTTGIIMSGNEISQILLSLILSYAGGQRNRPRWIAWGMVFCAISSFILALPHFIYGAGEDALLLTKEYQDLWQNIDDNVLSQKTYTDHTAVNLCTLSRPKKECHTIFAILPSILIFLSQFVLGIGNTLYYSLGQTYLDDNTKKTKTPLLFAYAMTLRLLGPIFGFLLGYISLNTFIDPTKTPLIDRKDPRWLGAWWIGWVVLGCTMLLLSGLIALFPKELPKRASKKLTERPDSETPRALRDNNRFDDNEEDLLNNSVNCISNNSAIAEVREIPKMRDLPKALLRLLKNKLLMFNYVSAIFYVVGAAGYMTFLTKYIEVQFHKSASNATVIVGPLTILGMALGLLGSGHLISRYKPSASKVLLWNILIGITFMLGQISYLFVYCGDTSSMMQNGVLNLSSSCNSKCSCDNVAYNPVCDDETYTTYFSPCHAGCVKWDSGKKFYSECSCVKESFLTTVSTNFPSTTVKNITGTEVSTTNYEQIEERTSEEYEETESSATTTTAVLSRKKRGDDPLEITSTLLPGACLKGCAKAFYIFMILSFFVQFFGSSGRIGNLLVNYRAVAFEDKSFAQGLGLMLISMFALIPGPIIFGRVIDATCLVWTEECGQRGNCQLYDQTAFRQYLNLTSLGFTFLGAFFDILVWYFGKSLDLYGEKEEQFLQEKNRRNKPITPLLARK